VKEHQRQEIRTCQGIIQREEVELALPGYCLAQLMIMYLISHRNHPLILHVILIIGCHHRTRLGQAHRQGNQASKPTTQLQIKLLINLPAYAIRSILTNSILGE
jgi:hypothetical protein